MIRVLFGSETGNSEEIAKRIHSEIKKIKVVDSKLSSMNAFSKELENTKNFSYSKNLIVIVCSTTGNGDPPQSSEQFIRFIKSKSLEENFFKNFEYALLGLGDSNYSKFMHIPRIIEINLTRLGAVAFVKKGEADDAYGLEDFVEPWIDNLIMEIQKSFQRFTRRLSIDEEQQFENTNPETKPLFYSTSDDSIYNYLINSKKKISGPDATKEIYSITLKTTSGLEAQYYPGSHINVIPILSSETSKAILSIIEIQSQDAIVIQQGALDISLIPVPTIYRDVIPYLNSHFEKNNGFITQNDLIKLVFDFTTIIKKSSLERILIWVQASISMEIDVTKIRALEKLQSTARYLKDNYNSNCLKNRVTLYDLLESIIKEDSTFKMKLTISEAFEMFPIKKPRSYSISTSFNSDLYVGVVFSVVKETFQRKINQANSFTRLKSKLHHINNFSDNLLSSSSLKYLGESSNYLKSLTEGDKLIVTSIKNSFPFNRELHLKQGYPLIYVSNGTGITPCLSYMKSILREDTSKMGQLMLINGYRSNSKETNDSIEEEFINQFHKVINDIHEVSTLKEIKTDIFSNKTVKMQYFSCCSENNETEEEEMGYWRNLRINYDYVQDIILDKKDEIFNLLFCQNATLMICGDVEKIFDEIISILVNSLMTIKKVEREQAIYEIEQLKAKGNINVEKWLI